jgi:hypothetical protein
MHFTATAAIVASAPAPIRRSTPESGKHVTIEPPFISVGYEDYSYTHLS